VPEMQNHKDNLYEGQGVDPIYSSGKYFEDSNKFSKDAQYKADNFLKLFLGFARQYNITIHSYVDVGCGSGDITKIISNSLKKEGFTLDIMKGYDVSPHVQTLKHEEVEFVHRDFCESDELVDLVTLIDVFEHIPNPIHFIQKVALRSKIIVFNIPLDYSLKWAHKDFFLYKLKKGHLLFMDAVFALNLLTLAGLRVVDYAYAHPFLHPSTRHESFRQKFILPIVLRLLKPFFFSKILGHSSLFVISFTQKGLCSIDLTNYFE
jgi:hypothetical protein